MSVFPRAYRNLARITRTIGRKGEVKVEPIDDLPFVLSPGVEVYLTPPPMRGIYCTRVLAVRPIDDGFAVHFAGVDDSATAFTVVGRTCLASSELLAGYDVRDAPVLGIGCAVVDAREGLIGFVEAVSSSSAQDLLVVVDDEGRETLVPLVDDIVSGIDDEGRILVTLPAGLYGLNG